MSIFDIFKGSNKKLREEILQFAKNEITIEALPENPVRHVGSKIGGKPFLPADFQWPVFNWEGEERPLSFFCQLNLAEFAPFDQEHQLPDHGLLSFFYECESFRWGFDPADQGAAKVYYFEDTAGFVPFEIPGSIETGYIMPELGISFSAKTAYPMYEEFIVHSPTECEWEDYDAILEKLGVDLEADFETHKALGYANLIQGEMLTECEQIARNVYCGGPEGYESLSEGERADIREKAKEWTLLLQLGTISTEDFEWMFGDCGILCFYIRKQDLANRNFDKSWFVLQCG